MKEKAETKTNRIVYVIFVTHEMSDRKKNALQTKIIGRKRKKQNAKNNFDTMRNIFYDDLWSWNLFLRGATKKEGIK